MATKKIIDIFPPKRTEKVEKKINNSKPVILKIKPAVSSVKEVIEEPELKEEKNFQFFETLKNFKFFISTISLKKKALFLLPLFLLFGMYFLSTLSATAKIEIWPKTEKTSFDAKVSLDKKVKQFDIQTVVIPAEIIEKEKTVSSNFPSSGKISKEAKSGGVITVYNNYSPSYQVLIANTRFVSTEGKVFRILEKVMIPGVISENGKLKAGEINVRVVSDQPGKEYDIGPDTFSIPGFAGTDKYTKFYAKSFQPFIGGFSESASQVTIADLNKAEDVLIQQAKSETENLLKDDLKTDSVSSIFNFLGENIQTEIIEKSSTAKAGSEVNEFNFQIKAKSKTLVFKKEDINSFVKNYISDKIPQGKKIYEPSLKTDYSVESVNFDLGTAQIVLKISADIYFDIDEKAIKNNISQKSLSEIKIFLSSQPEIKNVLVKMWPFWSKRAPKDINKIELKINFDSK